MSKIDVKNIDANSFCLDDILDIVKKKKKHAKKSKVKNNKK